MITPKFSLSQDDTFLTINITATYCNLKELEIVVNENDFRFFCAPYYLRLNLPGEIIDNENAAGSFSSETGEFVLKYMKATAGEHFNGLDLITSLLMTRNKQSELKTTPNIEVVSSTTNCDETESDDGNEWSVEQQINDNNENSQTTNSEYGYGFANKKYGIVRIDREDEYYGVFDLRNIEQTKINDRFKLQSDRELIDFSRDHYLADLYDDAYIQQLIDFECPWNKLDRNTITLTEEERTILVKDLYNKEFLLDPNERALVWCGLIDILYAYAYDQRSTEFEGNCESGWTLTKLSSTLSWMNTSSDLRKTIQSSYRRSLIYPLYRNWNLSSNIVRNDLVQLLRLGLVFVTKCLLQVYSIFNQSGNESRYILNELYIKDYLIFVQQSESVELEQLCEQVQEINIVQNDLNLSLNLDEESSEEEEEEEDDEDEIDNNDTVLNKMSQLNISSDKDSDDDD